MNSLESVIGAVGGLLQEAGQTIVLPALGRAEPYEKSPGEWVTAVDHASEEWLTRQLEGLLPGSTVVGEEGAHANPLLLGAIADDWVWLIDPLDGTSNFAQGHGPISIMVALLRSGVTVASWMYDPIGDRLFSAEQGSGATCSGQPARAVQAAPPVSQLRGAVLRRFLPADVAKAVDVGARDLPDVGVGTLCTGADYPDVVAGKQDFVLYWRTLPWDHAPGVLYLEEAGGYARRLNGDPFQPGETQRSGLLIATNPETWHAVRGALLAGV